MAAIKSFNSTNPAAFGDLSLGEACSHTLRQQVGRWPWPMQGLPVLGERCRPLPVAPCVRQCAWTRSTSWHVTCACFPLLLCTRLAGLEEGVSVEAVVAAWASVWRQYHRSPLDFGPALCLLLGNALEVVEQACASEHLAPKLNELLSGVSWPSSLIEVIKAMKRPSWRYRSEVRGLVDMAVRRITGEAFGSLDQVSQQGQVAKHMAVATPGRSRPGH